MLRSIIIAVCFVLAVISFGVAQTEPEPKPEKEPIIFSPGPSTSVRAMQEMLRLESQGKHTALYFVEDEEFLPFVGISEAQRIYLRKKLDAHEQFEVENATNFVNSLNRWQELPAEELARFEDAFFTFYEKSVNISDSIFEEALTPSQLQLVSEYHLATPGFIARVFTSIPGADTDQLAEIGVKFAAYEALGLSDEQKEALAKLQKESEEEMRPLWGDAKMFLEDFFEKAKNAESQEDADKLMQEILVKANELKDKATAITKKTKEKLEANLTPEQMERLAQIREEVPKKLAKIKKELEKKKAEAQDDSWKDAWKPGDPIPEHLQAPEPKRRFPFKL